MKSIKITVNGDEITCHEDGSVSKLNRSNMKVERRFGGCDAYGYPQRWVGGRNMKTHRLIAMAFLEDYSDDLQVDHINGVHNDNRVENLRMATASQNRRAFRMVTTGVSSKFRGVSWDKSMKKWAAYIAIGRKKTNLGYFLSETDAAIAFNEAAIELGFLPESLNKIH